MDENGNIIIDENWPEEVKELVRNFNSYKAEDYDEWLTVDDFKPEPIDIELISEEEPEEEFVSWQSEQARLNNERNEELWAKREAAEREEEERRNFEMYFLW